MRICTSSKDIVDMKETSDRDWNALFDQLPVDVIPSIDHHLDVRYRATEVFDDQSNSLQLTQNLKQIGQTLMKYKVPHGVAASLCIAFILWIGDSSGKPAVAIEALIEKFAEVKTLRYESTTKMEGGLVPGMVLKMKGFYSEPGLLRTENDRLLSIVDFVEGKSLSIDHQTKIAFRFSFSTDNLSQDIPGYEINENWIKSMQQFLKQAQDDKSAKVESLGLMQLDNRDVTGFRVGMEHRTATFWIDPKTQLPIRIEVTGIRPTRYEMVYTNFEFNVELDNSIFQLDIPDGYTASDASIDISLPTEKDLIRSLEMFAEKREGRFPLKFEQGYLQRSEGHFQLRVVEGANGDSNNDWLKSVLAYRRGFEFAFRLPDASEVHYAGANARLGERDRPIFWYKPIGSEAYRVIYADLSVRDTNEAPKIPDAIRVAN